MQIDVLFFASLAEETGCSSWRPTLPEGATLDELVQFMKETFPRAQNALSRCLIAVNQTYVKGTSSLSPGDEVAFFPPVSGG